MGKEIKLIAFDLDGVLINIKSSWQYIHDYVGSSTIVKRGRGIKLYSEGKISYQEWVDIDVQAMLIAKPTLSIHDIEEAFSKVKLEPSAKFVTKVLKNLGYKLAIVSAGIEQLAKRVANELGIDIVRANPLQFSKDGRLIGGIAMVEPLAKDKVIKDIAKQLGIELSEVAYIGDSEWDLSALKVVGLPIVLNCSKCLEQLDNAILINCLWEVLPIILRHRRNPR